MPDPSTPQRQTPVDIQQIMRLLPHRYPLLLIDRILEIEPKKRIVCLKNVTANEPQFQGHFPDFPLMPGVLLIEAIAQAGGALLLREYDNRDDKLMVFTGIDGAKFRKPVVPGDQVILEVNVLNWRTSAVKMRGTATVDGKLACEATVMCQLIPRPGGGTAAAGTARGGGAPVAGEASGGGASVGGGAPAAVDSPAVASSKTEASNAVALAGDAAIVGAPGVVQPALGATPALGDACRPDPLAVSEADSEAAV